MRFPMKDEIVFNVPVLQGNNDNYLWLRKQIVFVEYPFISAAGIGINIRVMQP